MSDTEFKVGDRVLIGPMGNHDEFTEQAVGRYGQVDLIGGASSVLEPWDGGEVWVSVRVEGPPINESNIYYFPSESLTIVPVEPAPTEPDVVKHPKHYSSGLPDGVQVIDIIDAQGADFHHGNVIKYILRWKFKNGIEDLKKAQVYLNWLIEKEESKNV